MTALGFLGSARCDRNSGEEVMQDRRIQCRIGRAAPACKGGCPPPSKSGWMAREAIPDEKHKNNSEGER